MEAQHGWCAHDLVHRSLQAIGGGDNVVVHAIQDAVHSHKFGAVVSQGLSVWRSTCHIGASVC